MARRLFLHVGTPKSGTTYLQTLWWRHRDSLAEQGLLLPGASNADHFRAASLVSERAAVVSALTPDERRTWDHLLEESSRWDGDALISHELFARATPDQADRELRRLSGVAAEVHVVVTGRDLSRQLPSGWQQNVKQGRTDTLREFWQRAREEDPDGEFWTYQDLPALLARWSQGLPPGHAHLVVLPPPGSPRDALWQLMCGLLGVDPAGLDTAVDRPNDSLGIVEVEVMRRIHAAVPDSRRNLVTARFAKGFFARRILVPVGPGEGFALPADIHAWAVERGTTMADDVRRQRIDVVGDLGGLVPGPQPEPGRVPDQVTEDEVAETAVAALTRLLLHQLDERDTINDLRRDRRRLRRRLKARRRALP